MIIVYRHRRLDTNEIFYVGIGKTEKRAYNKYNRSKFWKSITNKTDYSVEIISKVDTWEEACELEQFLIQEYGRKDLGTGILVNMTDGGEGMLGYKTSEETREKLSLARTGKKHTEETLKKLSLAKKGKPSNRKGIKMSEEHKAKIGKANKGEKNTTAKKVINTQTGVIYPTITESAEKEGFKNSTLWKMLNGKKPNKTNLMLI